MEIAQINKRLEIIEAKLTISDLLIIGARANDRQDIDGMRACYWPDAITNHGNYNGSSFGFIDYAVPIIKNCLFAAHHISNIQIEIRENRAIAESHYFAHHRKRAGENGLEEDAFFEGRYIDIFEQRDGIWKILYRRGLSDWSSSMVANVNYQDWPKGKHSMPVQNDEYFRIYEAFCKGENP